MIDGGKGRLTTLGIAVFIVLLTLVRAGLIVAKQADAANSLDSFIALLTGLFIGSVGITPYVHVHPPLVFPPTPQAPAASIAEQAKTVKPDGV